LSATATATRRIRQPRRLRIDILYRRAAATAISGSPPRGEASMAGGPPSGAVKSSIEPAIAPSLATPQRVTPVMATFVQRVRTPHTACEVDQTRRQETPMKLENRTVLITGGTSGIGLELASQLLQGGNVVIVTGRDQARLDAAMRSLPGVHGFKSDVADPREITELYGKVLAQFPKLDTLVNNAGIMRNLNLNQDRDLTDVTREIEINLSGPVRMVQQFLPHLKTRPNALIVNVSSGLAFLPLPIAPVYCATKAAIHSFTQSLRAQLEGASVTVVELAPPGTETPLFRGEFEREMGSQKAMDPKTLVKQAIAGIEAGKLEIRPGLANVLKIMSRLAPGFMLKQMTKMSKPKDAPAARTKAPTAG
jgi:uncharacterized oxidoreductase